LRVKVDTYAVRQITLPLAIIGWVLSAKGYLPWYAEIPLSWGSFLLYVIPRITFEYERNHA
jgi:hypothetical protein